MENRVTNVVTCFVIVISFLAFCQRTNAEEIPVQMLEKENEKIEQACIQEKNGAQCTRKDLEKYHENKTIIDEMKEKFRFGIGIGIETYQDAYIVDAETVGSQRIVRVTDSQDYKPSLWLETHYIWDGLASEWGFTHSAPGFYVGARLLGSNSDIFDAFSLGLLWSYKRTRLNDIPPKGQLAESINIGFGPVWHKTKVLAQRIKEGEPLPVEYNEVKFDRRDEISWMIMVSAGF